MTTNVYDVSAGILSSDSRWSFDDGDWIVFIDDTGYDKIIFDSTLGFLFAGDMANINRWKDWVSAGRLAPPPMHYLDETSIIAVEMASGAVIFNSDYLLQSIDGTDVQAWYGGTGGPYAKDCWQINKCAKTAVESAKAEDDYSGGQTLYLIRSTNETNVTNSESYLNVNKQCKERGLMMNTKGDRQTVLVKDAANDAGNAIAQGIAKKVMSGSVKLGAPFPGMQQPWTQEKKKELEAALERFAPK